MTQQPPIRFPVIRQGLTLLSTIGLLLSGGVRAQEIPEVTPTAAYAGVVAGKGILVDVRTPDEWRETGVPAGALRIDFQGPDFVPTLRQVAQTVPGKTLYLICRSGRRSLAAAAQLREAGVPDVVSVQHGVAGNNGWSRARLPLEDCQTCPPRTALPAHKE